MTNDETVNAVCHRLSHGATAADVAYARAWLENNRDSEHVPIVILKLDRYSTAASDVTWCSNWLQAHRPSLQNHPILWHTHTVIALKHQALLACYGDGSGESVYELLTLVRNEAAIDLGQRWFDQYAHVPQSFAVLQNLLRSAPTPENCVRARDFMNQTSDKYEIAWHLARLIQHDGDAELVNLALKILRRSTDESGFLADAVYSYSGDEEAKEEALQWWKSALQSADSRSAVQDAHTMLANCEISELVIDWLNRNPQDGFNSITWVKLIIKNPSDSTALACWSWLMENRHYERWDDIYYYLLFKSAPDSFAVPRGALEKAWEIFKSGSFGIGGTLARLDRSDGTVAQMFSLVEKLVETEVAESEKAGQIEDLISGLIAVDKSERIIELSKRWLLGNQDNVMKVRQTLEALLPVAPSEVPHRMISQLLNEIVNDLDYLHVLSLVVKCTRYEKFLVEAQNFLVLEFQLGFRNILASYCGQLLLVLFEIDEVTEAVAECAKKWVEFFAHDHSEVASKLRTAIGSR